VLINSGGISLGDIAKKLRNESINRVVASFGEHQVSVVRTVVLGVVLLWVWFWRTGPQEVLVKDALAVYPWSVAIFAASAVWMLLVRYGPLKAMRNVDGIGTIANFAIVLILTQNAFLLLITLEAVLPFLSITVGARYSKRLFYLSVAAGLLILLVSAPEGYWLSRPAYALYAVVLTVVLPLVIGRLLWALREVSVQAIEARDAQNRFIGAMSHELRTPLNTVINTSALIDTANLPEDQRRLMDLMSSNARALLHRVDDVLDVAALNARRIQYGSEPFSIVEVADTVRNVCITPATEKGLQLQVLLGDDVPRMLKGDPGRIEQALSNLTSNAIKFTPVGGSVTVAIKLVAPVLDGHADLVCTVSDTGVGISDENKSKIFDAFFQVSGGTARRHAGVGLGLFIVRSVSEQLGGSLAVSDNPGGGTIFTWRLKLPVDLSDQTGSAAQSLLETLHEHSRLVPRLNCLVIEDSAANVAILDLLLSEAGHDMTVAADGISGLTVAAAGTFDVILLDLHMPGMSGWDVLDAMSAAVDSQYPPVIVLSAESNADAIASALEKGASAFVSKPIAARRLLEVLERIAGNKGGNEPSPEISIQSPTDSVPLLNMRELGDSGEVGAYLGHVMAGLENGLHGIERALEQNDSIGAGNHAHALKNEFAGVGFVAGVVASDHMEDSLRRGAHVQAEMTALREQVTLAMAWLREQPEFADTARDQ
jgi:two-component system sensor histidine kinase RpfC